MHTQRTLLLASATLLVYYALPPSAPAADEYRYDDGQTEGALGVTLGGVLVWAHRFTVTEGNETITHVSSAFGAANHGRAPPEGTPFGIGVWSDPDQDGDPADGFLLSSATAKLENPDTDILQVVDIPDVYVGPVGTSFFVVVWIQHAPEEYPGPMDISSGPSLGRAWVTGEVGGTFDPEGFNPEIGWFEMDELGFPTVWLLRASADPEPLPGDIDGDGDVDLADLAILLAAYDTCEGDPNYNPAADIDNSGCVDLSDLAILLAHYGEGT